MIIACNKPESHAQIIIDFIGGYRLIDIASLDEMEFLCPECGRYVCGWCEGCDDDYPDLCDTCWADESKVFGSK